MTGMSNIEWRNDFIRLNSVYPKSQRFACFCCNSQRSIFVCIHRDETTTYGLEGNVLRSSSQTDSFRFCYHKSLSWICNISQFVIIFCCPSIILFFSRINCFVCGCKYINVITLDQRNRAIQICLNDIFLSFWSITIQTWIFIDIIWSCAFRSKQLDLIRVISDSITFGRSRNFSISLYEYIRIPYISGLIITNLSLNQFELICEIFRCLKTTCHNNIFIFSISRSYHIKFIIRLLSHSQFKCNQAIDVLCSIESRKLIFNRDRR